jgi:hypothetical protein
VSDAGQFALAIGLGGALIALLAGPIGQAIARRIAGGKPVGGETTGEMNAERVVELEQRMSELEGSAQARIAELEERLDFAERLLAQPGADREKVVPPRAANG